jgi:hypothetical protein
VGNVIEFYEDLEKLREEVKWLVQEGRIRILWHHIKPLHPCVTKAEVLNGLLYGLYKHDRERRGRYVAWSKLTRPPRLLRVVFEVRRMNGKFVVVVTAFEEG